MGTAPSVNQFDPSIEIECLACGHHRVVPSTAHEGFGECPHCRYVGWAEPAALSEQERMLLHRELAGTWRPAL